MENFKVNGTINQNNTRDMLGELVWFFLPTAVTIPPLALPINAVVIRFLVSKPGICCTSEIFTLNLAVFDMLFCLMFLAEYIHFLLNPTEEAANFIAWYLNQVGGPMFLCILSLDSYMAVCHPLVFLRLKDPKLRLSLCLVVNVVTAVSCCLMKVSKLFKWTVVLMLLSCATLITSTCNILILRSLGQTGPSRKEVHPVKRRAIKIVLTSFALVNVHYLPSLTEYMVRYYHPLDYSPLTALTCVTNVVVSMSSFIQPLCYLSRTKQLPKIRCHRNSAAEKTAVATA